jgi:rubredoxin
MPLEGPGPEVTEYKSLRQMSDDAAVPGSKLRVCPACEKQFLGVISTWDVSGGVRRRALKCSLCGHVMNTREIRDDQTICQRHDRIFKQTETCPECEKEDENA